MELTLGLRTVLQNGLRDLIFDFMSSEGINVRVLELYTQGNSRLRIPLQLDQNPYTFLFFLKRRKFFTRCSLQSRS